MMQNDRAQSEMFHEIFEDSPAALWVQDWSDIREMLEQISPATGGDLRDYFHQHPDEFCRAYDLTKTIEISKEITRVYEAPSKDVVYALAAQGNAIADPEELAGSCDAICTLFEGKLDHEYEAEEIAYDGSKIITRVRHVLPLDYKESWSRVLVTVEDITERKKAESALSESDTLLRQATEMAKLGHWVWDEVEDRCVHCSDTLAQMCGVSVEEYLSRYGTMEGLRRDVHWDDWERYETTIAEAKANRCTYDIEFRDRIAEGEYRYLREHGQPVIDENGKLIRTVGTIQDVNDYRQAEATLRKSEERLRELQSELFHVSRLSSMGELASSLAHELNQPLTAIMNYLQIVRWEVSAKDDALADEVGDMITEAIEQTDRAGTVIRNLRNFIEQGRTVHSEANINEVIKEASSLGLIGAAEKGINVRLGLSSDLPPAFIDMIQIQQVLLNLVRNAVEAMADSERKELTIGSTEGPEGFAEVSVIDTGPGLSDDIASQLFLPFTTSKPEGIGLGLSISRSIIEAHGGRLWVVPNPTGGTEFRFTVPIAP